MTNWLSFFIRLSFILYLKNYKCVVSDEKLIIYITVACWAFDVCRAIETILNARRVPVGFGKSATLTATITELKSTNIHFAL